MDVLDELTLLIKAAQREGDRRVNAVLRPLGLTAAQAEVLLVLAAAEPLSLGELGGLLVAEGGHPTRLVLRLVEAGLVQRTGALDDRRRLELRLTPGGRALAEQAATRKSELLERSRGLTEGLDLRPILTLLEGYLADGPWADTVRRRRVLDSAGHLPAQV